MHALDHNLRVRVAKSLLISLLFTHGLALPSIPAQAIISDGANAIDALGQYGNTICTTQTPNYTKNAIVNSTLHPYGFFDPSYTTIDSTNHRLFVADANRRVLVFNLNASDQLVDRVPDNILGQPDFSSGSAALTQAGMSNPQGLVYDSVGNRLFVADATYNRVLVYDGASITDGENAVNVLGQVNFTSSTAALTQSNMNFPTGLAYDGSGSRLFVSDNVNNRVLVYDVASITDGENAMNVLGQPDFVTG